MLLALLLIGMAGAARSGGLGTAADVLRKQIEDGAYAQIVEHVEALRSQICPSEDMECQRLLLDPLVVDCLAKGSRCDSWHLERAQSPNVCSVDLPKMEVACQARLTPKFHVRASKPDAWTQSTALTHNPHGDYASCWTYGMTSHGMIRHATQSSISKAGCPQGDN